MANRTTQAAYLVYGPSVIALAYAVGSWAMTEACLFMLHVRPLAYGMAALPWLFPVTLIIWRAKRYVAQHEYFFDASQPWRIDPADIGWACLLVAVGSVIGGFIVLGKILLIFLVAGPLGFAPWHRMPICRRHVGWACSLMLAGAALVLGANHASLAPMSLGLAAWALTGCCGVALLWQTRAIKSARQAADAEPQRSAPGLPTSFQQ